MPRTPKPLLVAAATAGTLVLALTGCGGSSADDSGGGKKAGDVHIAFVFAASNQNFAKEMAAGAKYAGQQYGVDVQTLAPPQVDGPAQVTLFQTAVKTATDGVVVATLTPPLFTRPVATAIRSGVPVIAADNQLPADSGVTTFVGNNNAAAGALLADQALKDIPAGKKGTVVVGIPKPAVPVLKARAAGIKKELQARRPDLTVLGPYDTKQDPEQSYEAWNNLVKAHSDAVAYLDAGDPASVSLPKIKQQNKGTYVVGAFDLDAGGLTAVQAGISTAVVDPQHWLKGYISTRLLIEKALGKRDSLPKGWWNNGAALVTKANVDQIIARQRTEKSKSDFFAPIADKQFADIDSYVKPLSEVS